MSAALTREPRFSDTGILAGIFAWRVWSLLAWQDIKMRYRGSALGPVWMICNLAVILGAVSVLYSELLKQPLETFVPFLAISLVLMNFIWPILLESCHAFAGAPDVIRQVKLPLTTFVMRVMYRNAIILAHNVLVAIAVFALVAIFAKPIASRPIEALFGLALLVLNLGWISLIFAMLGARFRDMLQVATSVLNFMAIITPIYWVPALISKFQFFLNINPFYHLFQVVRAPLLGQDVLALTYMVTIGMAVGGWALTAYVFHRLRKQIVYWV
jgi:ABC-type polysaccharide/polyol phosphate export permease